MAVEAKPAALNLRNQKDSSIGRVMDEYKKSDATVKGGNAGTMPTSASALGSGAGKSGGPGSDVIDDKLSKLQGLLKMAKNQ